MNPSEHDDFDDDRECAEPCPDCDRVFCHCDDPHYCDECMTWGEFQCSKHSDSYIEMQREEHERHAALEALRTIIALPDVGQSAAWRRLLSAARVALAEMEPAGIECTGLTARWCPVCGDCTCGPRYEGDPNGERTLNDYGCPLHGGDSAHCTEDR